MATTAPSGNLISIASVRSTSAGPRATVSLRRPRQISPEAGRGIEMLGHAIDYLADEFALDCLGRNIGAEAGLPPILQAIELLMARNREIFLNCPEAPTTMERLRGWIRWNRN